MGRTWDQSQGKTRRVHEIQNHRANPAKAEPVSQFCDYWFVVAEVGVVKKDEVPLSWGFWEARGDKIYSVKEAVRREDVAITRSFMAALFRSMGKADDKMIEISIGKKVQALDESREKDFQRRLDRRLNENAELRKKVDQFQEVTGIDISSWRHESSQLAKAVNFVLAAGVHGTRKSAEKLRDELRESADRIDKALSPKVENEQA